MKTSASSVLGLLSLVGVGSSGVAAFSAAPPAVRTTSTSTTTSLHASTGSVSRRDCWKAAAAAVAVVATSATAAPQAANAALNFEQVQDLLNTPEKTAAAYDSSSNSGARPMFLVDPTQEFKDNEEKATAFKRKELQAKKAFAVVQEKITTDPNDETMLLTSLDEMRRLVKRGGGLPAGILKDDVIRTVRRRKSKKYWPVNCEIAYQDLMDEIRFQQSPNQQRDMDNPF
jgi:hypothetical protein